MNRLQIQNLVYALLQESSTNTAFPVDTVNEWINQGYRDLCAAKDWPFLYEDAVITLPYTTCSEAGTSTGTTLYVEDATGMFAGQKLLVNDNSIFEEVTISSVAGGVITLTSPGLSSSYTHEDEVAGISFQKPADLQKLVVVRAEKIASGLQQTEELIRIPERERYVLFPTPDSTGFPTRYFERGSTVHLYPVPDFSCRVLVTYVKTPADLSTDADVPVFPARYHQILAYSAVASAFEKDDNMSLAGYYRQLYLKELGKMKVEYARMYDGLLSFLPDNGQLPGFSY